MSIREWINKRPWAGYVGAALVLAIAAKGLLSYSMSRSGIILNTKSYFTADDGKTTFVDSETRPTPFRLPDGREAVLAHVFTRDGNDRFVAFLERDDGGKLNNVRRSKDSSFAPPSMASRVVKHPGDGTWVKMVSSEAMNITNVRGSDGAQLTEVLPESR
jgi:hypothetical protein